MNYINLTGVPISVYNVSQFINLRFGEYAVAARLHCIADGVKGNPVQKIDSHGYLGITQMIQGDIQSLFVDIQSIDRLIVNFAIIKKAQSLNHFLAKQMLTPFNFVRLATDNPFRLDLTKLGCQGFASIPQDAYCEKDTYFDLLIPSLIN